MQEREGKGERERGKRIFTNTGSKNSSWPVNSRTITAVLNVLVAPALIAAAPVSLFIRNPKEKGRREREREKGRGERRGRGGKEEERGRERGEFEERSERRRERGKEGRKNGRKEGRKEGRREGRGGRKEGRKGRGRIQTNKSITTRSDVSRLEE